MNLLLAGFMERAAELGISEQAAAGLFKTASRSDILRQFVRSHSTESLRYPWHAQNVFDHLTEDVLSPRRLSRRIPDLMQAAGTYGRVPLPKVLASSEIPEQALKASVDLEAVRDAVRQIRELRRLHIT